MVVEVDEDAHGSATVVVRPPPAGARWRRAGRPVLAGKPASLDGIAPRAVAEWIDHIEMVVAGLDRWIAAARLAVLARPAMGHGPAWRTTSQARP